MSTPFTNVPIVGEKAEFEDFSLSFIVDEYLENYLSLHEWITGQGFPESTKQYTTFRDVTGDTSSTNTSKFGRTGDRSMYSDATLTVLSNKNNPIIEIRFRDMFPVTLAALDFDQGATDASLISCSATFKYQQYKIVPIK